ncbi:hypothetical protein U9M48_006769 [Paspalum notatum var. saurae]|uniref:Uncharacterized protein n=1 Tax=Paspalum notatum var. saurae TaxID=547442 RepID=A0AAQ3PU09_PASNO
MWNSDSPCGYVIRTRGLRFMSVEIDTGKLIQEQDMESEGQTFQRPTCQQHMLTFVHDYTTTSQSLEESVRLETVAQELLGLGIASSSEDQGSFVDNFDECWLIVIRGLKPMKVHDCCCNICEAGIPIGRDSQAHRTTTKHHSKREEEAAAAARKVTSPPATEGRRRVPSRRRACAISSATVVTTMHRLRGEATRRGMYSGGRPHPRHHHRLRLRRARQLVPWGRRDGTPPYREELAGASLTVASAPAEALPVPASTTPPAPPAARHGASTAPATRAGRGSGRRVVRSCNRCFPVVLLASTTPPAPPAAHHGASTVLATRAGGGSGRVVGASTWCLPVIANLVAAPLHRRRAPTLLQHSIDYQCLTIALHVAGTTRVAICSRVEMSTVSAKKLLALKHVEKESILRGGVTYQVNNIRVKGYAASIKPNTQDIFTELPGAKASAPLPVRQFTLLPLKAQCSSRRLILIVKDLYDNGLVLSHISEDSFSVDPESEYPQLRWDSYEHDLEEVNPDPTVGMDQIDRSIASVADIIEHNICASCLPTVPEEVRDGLLPLMRNNGFNMLPVIANHPSMVPLDNRFDFNKRMHTEVADVLSRLSQAQYKQVLSAILFPADWRVLANENIYLRQFILGKNGARTYDINETDPEKIAFQVLRFVRNSGEHCMEHCMEKSVKRHMVTFKRIQIAQLFTCTFPMTMHSMMCELHKLNRLADLNLESLFN